jgi:hypothetical protein
MEIRFNVDMKVIRKAFALLEVEIPSDEEVQQKFANAVVDLTKMDSDEDIRQAELGFVVLAIGAVYDEQKQKS